MPHESASRQVGAGPVSGPRLRRIRALSATLLGIAMLACIAPVPGVAQEAPQRSTATERGRALYETRCIGCHETSVHQRDARRAPDFPSLRGEVARWNTTAGGEWRDEEIDAVSAYLNDRFYRFTCPPSICRAPPRAALPGGG